MRPTKFEVFIYKNFYWYTFKVVREQIEQILTKYGETIQFNTDISPEDAMQTAVDALMRIIQDSK